MSFNPVQLLPLASQLADYVRQAVTHYGALRASGVEVDADVLAVFLDAKTVSWEPTVAGIAVLRDPKTRAAGCRFLAGIAFAIGGS